MVRKSLLLACTCLLLCVFATVAHAGPALVAEGYLLSSEGNRIDFEVPFGNQLLIEDKASGSAYGLVPQLLPDGKRVEFRLSLLSEDATREVLEVERIEMAAGESYEPKTFGTPFSLHFKSVGIAEEKPTNLAADKHCIRCTVGCGSLVLSCTVCTPGFCCTIRCNGVPICTVCHL